MPMSFAPWTMPLPWFSVFDDPVPLPRNGRAPGWDAGIAVARRR